MNSCWRSAQVVAVRAPAAGVFASETELIRYGRDGARAEVTAHVVDHRLRFLATPTLRRPEEKPRVNSPANKQ